MKKVYKFLALLIVMSVVTIDVFAASLKHKTTFRRGPGEHYAATAIVDKDRPIRILSPKMYDDKGRCWVCIKDSFSIQRRVGYVQIDNIKYESFELYSFKKRSKFINFYTKVSNAFLVNRSYIIYKFETLFLDTTAKLKWWSLVLLSAILTLVALFIHLIHSYDKSYNKPLIHYILYCIAVIPTWALCEIAAMYVAKLDTLHSIALFLMAMTPAIITINGGWGVRQCGMIDGKNFDGINYVIGQIMQFPVWFWLISMVWDIAIDPLIEWSETFEYHGGGFWRFVLGIGGGFCITGAILIGYVILMIYCLKKAGKTPICVMAIALWWAIVRIAYNWAYANFNGLGFILIVFWGAAALVAVIIATLSYINEIRCPICHNCDGEQTGLVDHGISTQVSTSSESMGNHLIDPINRDAEVSDARREVSTTSFFHSWTTEHTCPNCGNQWVCDHEKYIGSISRENWRRWTETY